MSGGPHGPVFLVGCPRSGTTLLQAMLDAHPQVAVAPETHFMRRFFKTRREHGDLARDENLERLARRIAATPEFAQMELDGDRFVAAAHAAPRRLDALFALWLEQFRARRGARLVGEKTPNHLLFMRPLEKWFAGARFVHILRDPRAVALSWRQVPWTNGSLAADAEVWRKYMAAARKRAPHDPARILTLRYEALVARPEAELRALCGFLGLPFDEAMLAFHDSRRPLVDVSAEPWKQGALGPLDAAAAGRWRSALTPGEVRAVEQVAWFEMRRLDYRPVHGAARLLPGALVAAASRRIRALQRIRALRRRRSAGG